MQLSARTKKLLTIGAIAVSALVVSGSGVASPLATLPVNVGAPVLSGPPYVGKTLTTTKGSWQNSPTTYGYQWIRCDTKGSGCVLISGAASNSYVPTSADVGHTIEALVSAANAAGRAAAVNSQLTAAISPAQPPVSRSTPTIVGTPLVGQRLVAVPGAYTGGAITSYGYQWQRCNSSTLNCGSITGATHQDYAVVTGDLGQRLRVEIVATNSFGHTTTSTNATDPVTAPVVVVTTTLLTRATSTICCQTVQLSGVISPAHAGEQITILAREFDALATHTATLATTDANGNWTAAVTPTIQTTYTALTTTSTSLPVTQSVHPRVGFGVNGNVFTAKITGREAFAGRIAYFQMRTSTGSWRRLALVVINQNSVAKFRKPLPRGHTYTLRIYLTKAQAGAGYLDGTSEVQRVGGTK
jgi:hypothetical protein